MLVASTSAIGFLGLDFLVLVRTRRRREQMKQDLPEALDVLAVGVEAGLSFDSALAKLNEHMEGPLVEQFTLVLNELAVGQSRAGALKRMAERVDMAEVTALAALLIQSEQLGTPLARILRTQASECRARRQVAAEERAMKAPVKMIVPTGIFILPALFIVIVGPAVLSIGKTFGA